MTNQKALAQSDPSLTVNLDEMGCGDDCPPPPGGGGGFGPPGGGGGFGPPGGGGGFGPPGGGGGFGPPGGGQFGASRGGAGPRGAMGGPMGQMGQMGRPGGPMGQMGGPMGQMGAHMGGPMGLPLAELDLSEAQMEKISALRSKTQDQTAPIHLKLQSLERDFRSALVGSKLDQNELRRLRSEIASQKQALDDTMSDSMVKTAEILTPEQRQSLKSSMNRAEFGGGFGKRVQASSTTSTTTKARQTKAQN